MSDVILRLALPSPLRRLFDYRAPASMARQPLTPGMRIRVPFGRREMIGVLVEVCDQSEVPADKLKPASALLEQALLHTTSRPQAWPSWAQHNHLDPHALKFGQGFEHLYYLLEAAVAGLGVAIAPQPLVAEDLKAGRLVAPWGFSQTPAQLALWLPKRAADGRARQLAQWLKNELHQVD